MSAVPNTGFFFTFDDDNRSEAVEPPPPSKPLTQPQATIPLNQFPWYTLSSNTLKSWLSYYPSHTPCAVQAPREEPSQEKTDCVKANNTIGEERTDKLIARGKPSPSSLVIPATQHRFYVLQYQNGLDLPNLVKWPCSGMECGEHTKRCHDTTTTCNEFRDIVPNQYYGGLKVWSCAPDLARYVISLEPMWRDAGHVFGRELSSLVFAEVGCGQALPALAAICIGARTVILQDYNKEVLELCVKPNIAATVTRNALPASVSHEKGLGTDKELRVQFVDGDWAELMWFEPLGVENSAHGVHDGGCDVVLGSDVTFDNDSCWKLSQLLERWLRPITGVAFIATKVYYFGTNGGSFEFAQCASRFGLTTEEVVHLSEGGGMKRVILKVCKTK